MANIFVFVWIGLGLSLAFRRLAEWVPSSGSGAHWRKPAVLAIVAIVPITIQIASHYDELDESDNDHFEKFGATLLEPLATGSLLITGEDIAHTTVLYQQYCNGYRRDVRVVSQNFLTYDWAKRNIEIHQEGVVIPGSRYQPGMPSGLRNSPAQPYSMSSFLERNSAHSPVYIAFHFREDEIQTLAHYAEISQGLASRVVPKSEIGTIDLRSQLINSARSLSLFDPKPLADKAPGSWEILMARRHAEATERVEQIRAAVGGPGHH